MFARRAPAPDDLAAYVPEPTRLRVLRADGQRIDLTSRTAGQSLVASRQGWQPEAFAYRDMIGELRYAIRLLARSVAKVRFYVAETRPHPLDPAPLDTPDGETPTHGLDAQLAADAVHNFGRLPLDANPDGFAARAVENLSIAGEGWVHLDADEQFHVRSVSEVTASADGRVTLNGLPTAVQGSTRLINPDTESLMRLWIPHPEWAQLADSPMRSLLHVCEDVVLAGREQRSAARSRLAANGILFISEGMSLVRTRDEDDDRDDAVTSDTFMGDFVTAITSPIADDGDAMGVAPIVIRGAIEDIAAVQHVTFDRADSKELIARQSAAILRLLKGLDIQPEQVEGLGSSNHWCVDEQTEALTTRGWVGQADLRAGDVVLTLNHETGLSEWQPVLHIYRAQVVDESMVSIEGRRHSSLTTANHRWPVQTVHGSDWATSSALLAETTTTYRHADEVRHRRERAASLRAEGRSYQAIGDELGVSEAMARRYVSRPDIGSRVVAARAGKGNGGKFMSLAAPHADLPTQPKYDDALVELVAWFFTEGGADARPGRRVPQVTIYQSYVVNPDNVARIRRALTNLFGPESAQLDKGGRYATPESVARRARARTLHCEGWTIADIAAELNVSTVMAGKYLRLDAKPGPQGPEWRERRTQRGMSQFVLNTDAARVLLDHAPARVVTHEFVTALTAAQLELFLDTAIRGDGSRQARGIGTPVIGQKDPAMLDAMETAAILAGYSVMRYAVTGEGRSATGPRVRTQHCLSFTDSPLRTKYAPRASSVTEATYTGTVWCPTTSNRTWCARRRGTVYFTGNSAWAVDARSIRDQVAPMAETLAACLSQAFLRPVLEALGHSAQDAARVTIAVDVSPLAENPNRGQDARDAHAALAISDDAFREALGFDADDAPEEAEVIRRLAAMGRLPADLAAAILGVTPAGPRERITVPGETVQVRQLPAGDADRPAASPGQVVPDRATPSEPDLGRGPGGPVVAAAPPEDQWRIVVASELADIDTALLDRITTAADAAIARVVERAGARVRTAARRDHAVVASLDGVEAHLIAAHLGRDRVEALVSVTDLLVDGYQRLQAQVGRWVDAAAVQVADAVLRILRLRKSTPRGRQVHDTVTVRLRDRSSAVWPRLAEALDAAAERALFAPDPLQPDTDRAGEHADTLIRPGEVRHALDAIGGDGATAGGAGGFGTGGAVREILGEEGGVILGYEWLYRPELARDSFPPHRGLDGLRFATFTDPKLDTGPTTAWLGEYFAPGDHLGCFIAGTEVSGPPATASFVRPYRGEGVEIRTESGKVLTGTPNHPILTPRGWIPMGELGEGDEVVVARDGEGSLAVDDEAHQVPALIEDVAATLPMAQSVVTRPVPSAAEHFHGDGTGSDGEVTVVRTDGRLLADDEAAVSQLGRDDVFELAGVGEGALASSGVPELLLPSDGLPAHGGVGRTGKGFPLLGRRVVVPDVHRLAAVAGNDASVQQHPTDDLSAAPVTLSERELAGPVHVSRDHNGVVIDESFVSGRDRPASAGIACGTGAALPLIGSDGGPVDVLGLFVPAKGDAVADEHMSQRGHVPAEPTREGGETSALTVGRDERGSQCGVPFLRSGDATPVCAEEIVYRARAAAVSTPKRLNGLPGVVPREEVTESGISHTPGLNSMVLAEDPLDRSGGYPVPTGESLDRFASGVATEKVVEIVRRPLDCHVYNLTTTTGWYIANGVIVHNCQCESVPVLAFPELDDGVVAQRLREAAGNPRNILAGQVAGQDDREGRVGTSLQNEVEIRTRITDAVERLQREHIGGVS